MMNDKEYLETQEKLEYDTENDCFKQSEALDKIKEYNKALCEKYPFLKLYKVMTGEEIEGYEYVSTWLDAMPNGWRKAFGIEMCEKILNALKKANYVNEYKITQIKEKYGGLRWYSGAAPEEVHKIVSEYESISEKTCIECGEPAEYVSTGWICPFCKECAEDIAKKRKWKFEDAYKKIEDTYGE